MFKKLVKYQVISALTAMTITLICVQMSAGSGEARSVLSATIFLKSLVLIFFNTAFYLMIVEPKSKILLLFSFISLSVFDLLNMLINKSSIGVEFSNEIIKSSFFFLTILNLIMALICAKNWRDWITDKEIIHKNDINEE
jgi:hypothetical protein